MNLFRKKPSAKLVLPPPITSAIEWKEWRGNLPLTKEVGKFLSSPVGVAWVQMLASSSPITMESADFGVSNDDRAYRLAKIEGYQICLDRLIKSGVFLETVNSDLKPTFEPEL